MYPYCKYSDGTEVVFSGIITNENGEETIQIHYLIASRTRIDVKDIQRHIDLIRDK